MDGVLAHPGSPRMSARFRAPFDFFVRIGASARRVLQGFSPGVSAAASQSASAKPSARRGMVRRREIDAVPRDATLDQVLAIFRSRPHSRLPVFDGSLDNVVGVLSATQVLAALTDPEEFSVPASMSLPLFVPETLPADELLIAMRQQDCH